MLLRAGEIHQRRAIIFFLEQAHIHLQSIRQREADFVLSMRQLLIDVRKFQDVFRQRVDMLLRSESLPQRHQQVQVTNGLFSSPQRTRRRYRIHRFSCFLDMPCNRQRRHFRRVNQEPPRRLLVNLHGFQNILFTFFAEPWQIAQLLLSRQPLHVRDGGCLEVRPQKRHFLRPQRLQLQHVQNRRRIFFQQLLSQRIIAGFHNFLQMLDHALADSRQLFELLRLLDQLLH